MTLKFICAVAIKEEIKGLLHSYNDKNIDVSFDLNPIVAARLMDGELFNIAITNPWHVTELAEKGLVYAPSHFPFGRVPLAIGIHQDCRAGVLTDIDAIRSLLVASTSIAFTGEGTSGKAFLSVVERLGITTDIFGKAKPLGAGEPVKAVAAGDFEICAAPLTTIVAAKGVSPIAIIPSKLGASIDLSLFLHPDARDNKAAVALSMFLLDSDRDAYLKSKGIERFRFA